MVGAENDFCEENGQCSCKEHFGGEKCNQCSNNHLPYPACIPGMFMLKRAALFAKQKH